SVEWEPLAIDVAGHPDDQEVGIELVGARLGERPRRPPLADRLHDRLEVPAGVPETVFQGAGFWGRPAARDLGPLAAPAAVGQDRARDPWEAALKLLEAARAAEHLAHDQKRPTVTEDLGALGDRAVLRVAAHPAHDASRGSAADQPQVWNPNRLVRKSS